MPRSFQIPLQEIRKSNRRDSREEADATLRDVVSVAISVLRKQRGGGGDASRVCRDFECLEDMSIVQVGD
jgi:hypothetical protein